MLTKNRGHGNQSINFSIGNSHNRERSGQKEGEDQERVNMNRTQPLIQQKEEVLHGKHACWMQLNVSTMETNQTTPYEFSFCTHLHS